MEINLDFYSVFKRKPFEGSNKILFILSIYCSGCQTVGGLLGHSLQEGEADHD